MSWYKELQATTLNNCLIVNLYVKGQALNGLIWIIT